MNRLITLLQSAQNLSVNDLMEDLIKDRRFTDFILFANRYDQLYDRGIDSDGKTLGDYSPYTIIQKEKKGQPTDRVTLFDEGDLYRSFKTFLDQNHDVIISAYTACYAVCCPCINGVTARAARSIFTSKTS